MFGMAMPINKWLALPGHPCVCAIVMLRNTPVHVAKVWDVDLAASPTWIVRSVADASPGGQMAVHKAPGPATTATRRSHQTPRPLAWIEHVRVSHCKCTLVD
ncbi:hypothetical protein LSAT2_004393 [Lamellibrachia satsuma]|nr:hypothetical protein LSAT2_004393 [Lamellibrachia satsuma]